MNTTSECDTESTKLQIACKHGLEDEIRKLINEGCDIDAGPDPALHIALRRRHTKCAILLLQAGADFEVKDSLQDYPLHIACAGGLVEAAQVLCALGCSIEIKDARGLYPLHLAARHGHVSIVRCLCAAGCNLDVRNGDNIRADITALKYGHNTIADLLDRLKKGGLREAYARQLIPTTKVISRLTLRLLGHCGVGKTSMVKSLGAGLFSALFRRSSSLQSNKSRPSSPINSQIEMDLTSRQNSLTFEATSNYQSTKGVNVQHLDLSNVGEVTVWEFSGQETYFPVYHHFLFANAQALTCILFSLEESFAIQLQQVCFWMNFLLARQYADLETSNYGKILLIATHVDTTRTIKNPQGEWISADAQKILETVQKLMPHATNLCSNILVLDCNVPAAYPFKQLKGLLATMKQECSQQNTGIGTGLLEATLAWLPTLRKEKEFFPVLTKQAFGVALRAQVNLLASDVHIKDLLHQLHLFGEIFCVDTLIILSVDWLCGDLLGELLSPPFIRNARVVGVYTPDDFQAVYGCCDALELLQLLQALHLCIECDNDGEVEYEFPVYLKTETLSGLWDAGHPIYRMTGACYGGVRLTLPMGTCYLLTAIFPHIQIELRKASFENANSETEIDLYNWHWGSKLCAGALESLITFHPLPNGRQYIEVKVRGPRETEKASFFYLHSLVDVIHDAVMSVTPGLLIEQMPISPYQLRIHCAGAYGYDPHTLMNTLINSESVLDITLTNPDCNKQETILQILLFNSEALIPAIKWGCSEQASTLPNPIKLRLCGLLDPPEERGCDWCLLGLRLGLNQDRIAGLECAHSSHTMRILALAECTIGALITHLHELGRQDAADVVLRTAPLFRVVSD